MDLNKTQVTAMMNHSLNDNLTLSNSLNTSAWGYWQDGYYPTVIRQSYPIYLQERSEDKGQKAFEIIKHLQDKKLIKLDKVSDFIDAMDTLIKII
jgi:hypothetical protein